MLNFERYSPYTYVYINACWTYYVTSAMGSSAIKLQMSDITFLIDVVNADFIQDISILCFEIASFLCFMGTLFFF